MVSFVGRVHLPTRVSLPLAGLAALGLALAPARADSPPELDQPPPVSFARSIRPLLEIHCLRCHGEQQQQGMLKLTTRAEAAAGGKSGLNPLALPLATNELLRRLQSTDEKERMPLGAPPLPAEQIALFERWLEQGAAYHDPPSAAEPIPWTEAWLSRLADVYDAIDGPRLMPAAYAALAILVLQWLALRARRRALQGRLAGSDWRSRAARGLAGVSGGYFLFALALAALYAIGQFAGQQLGRVASLQEQLREAHLKQAMREGVVAYDAQRPALLRPMHPPRLGGTYYRGNDERNEQLYNGGFYRTATFHLELLDADREPLQTGDELPAEAWIRLRIERAPFATPALFQEETMANVRLSDVAPAGIAKATPEQLLPLTTLQAGQAWEVEYRLPPGEPGENSPAREGTLYLYQGVGANGQAHYAIGYDLKRAEGKLAPDAELWLASVYNSIHLQWPEPGRIPFDQWLDFRPIPEIEGGNTTDRKLLGIDDYFGPGKPAGEAPPSPAPENKPAGRE